MWEKNLNVVYFWNNIHVTGKIWQPQYRVTETIGLIGTLPLAISPLLFFANKEKIPISTAVQQLPGKLSDRRVLPYQFRNNQDNVIGEKKKGSLFVWAQVCQEF